MFNYLEHYKTIFSKSNQFIKDFRLLNHIFYVDNTKRNPSFVCKEQPNDPKSHNKAKNKIFELFVNDPRYLIETEIRSTRKLNIPHVGDRAYQLDILIVNIPNWFKFRNHIMDIDIFHVELNKKLLKELEQSLMFIVELDGTSHVDRKDKVRDEFFFTEYNIVTRRYNVNHLIEMEQTEAETKARLKYNFYKPPSKPLYENITSDQIVQECRNIYLKKYSHW